MTTIRPIRIEGDVAYVTLTKGYEAIIDAEDVPLVERRSWHAQEVLRADGSVGITYAITTKRIAGKQHMIRMHRMITSAPSSIQVDHRDGDGLNCRQTNLRKATASQNQCNQRISLANTSGVKGVTWHKKTRKWLAQIAICGQKKSLGVHACRTAAAVAYAKASMKLHGEFGRTS